MPVFPFGFLALALGRWWVSMRYALPSFICLLPCMKPWDCQNRSALLFSSLVSAHKAVVLDRKGRRCRSDGWEGGGEVVRMGGRGGGRS